MANPIKQTLKRGLQTLAARLGPHTRAPDEPVLLIIMYHRVLPRDDERVLFEEPGMFVSPQSFRQNLQCLNEYFEFVSLQDWIEKRQQGQSVPRKACAITFDDGWADNYEYAFPILRELGIPATIFLVSDMIDSEQMFWPEKVARLIHAISTQQNPPWSHPCLSWLRVPTTGFTYSSQSPSSEQISEIIAGLKKYPDAQIHQLIAQAEQELGLSIVAVKPPLLNWQQVMEMVNSGLIDMGSHTCHHTRLNGNTPDALMQQEIIDSKHTIEKQTGQPVRSFCFPNGDYDERALALVKQHYSVTVTTESGWNSLSSDAHRLKRIGVHEDIAKNRTAFLASISGWL